ncbi:MAG: DUF6273 domain-containing protein [Actinobacteria bacterium]|nr:DUF6273 domain-containing protein [Actinomycetota bacterium]
MKRKIFILAVIIVFILTMIPAGIINADPAIPGTSLNLYLGNGVASDSYVKFGQYEGQDILWRVLRQDNGTDGVLLISDKILTVRQFDTGTTNIWRDSSIRTWLNDTFYNDLGADKDYIETTTISASSIISQDKIFLPSISIMQQSPFNSDNGPDTKRIAYYGANPRIYWSIDRGIAVPPSYYVFIIYANGSTSGGQLVTYTDGVRPMLYLTTGLWFSGSGTLSDPYIITSPPVTQSITESEKPVWVRPMPMTCWQVFINEDNMFEFIFWYPYKDNNWMQIFDMEGNMVYEVDVPLKDPHIIVDLPDGMYNVKTFRFDPEDPIQEFIIGKP